MPIFIFHVNRSIFEIVFYLFLKSYFNKDFEDLIDSIHSPDNDSIIS